jgi:hypothetical protein
VNVHAGDLVWITPDARVQFLEPLRLRVIRELSWSTYEGWVWLDGYQLDSEFQAVQRRQIFVQRAGLKPAKSPGP